jgi:hypothetical protein
MKIILITFFLFISITNPGLAQDIDNLKPIEREPAVDFFQEEITLTVTDSTMRLDGIYHFRNNTPRNIPLPFSFPFYVDSTISYPHFIEAYMLSDDGEKQRIDISEIRKTNSFRARIPLIAKSEATWQLAYEQKIESKRAVYIITSTAAWKKPLTQATYIFVTPEDFEISFIWPEPDSSFTKDGLVYRQCVKHDFLPSREMEIIWK